MDFRVEEVSFNAAGADDEKLEFRKTPKGVVIAGRKLRDYTSAKITLVIESNTDVKDVAQAVLRGKANRKFEFGYHVLCHDTKFRSFFRARTPAKTEIKLDLASLGGVVQIEPICIASDNCKSNDGVPLPPGTVLARTEKPVFLAIDEDWAGDHIPLRWINFREKDLPDSALVHVQFVGSIPEVWLNDRFKDHLKILDAKGAKIGGIAGAALRELIWVLVWEKVLIWSLENEDENRWELPATRIAHKWRSELAKHDLKLPHWEELGSDELNRTSLAIQHCLETGRKLSRIKEILTFPTR